MTEEKRTLIETFLPVDEITEEAKLEKLGNAKPPTSSLHYWWTRKPLVASRAAVLGALLPADFDPQEFKNLIGLNRNERAHKYDISIERIEQLKKEYKKVWGEIPVILDPFAGGGSIPFEAMRVGLNGIANDYNPVAHIIEKATLEYPRKYGEKIYKDVETGLNWIFNETKKEMGQYYPKHDFKDVAAYIWAWNARCNSCNFDNPLVGQWWLVNYGKNHQYIKWEIKNAELIFSIEKGKNAQDGNCSDAKGQCLNCGSTIKKEQIVKEIKDRDAETLLAVVTNNKSKEYAIANLDDFKAFENAKRELKKKTSSFEKDDLLPFEEIPESNDVRSRPYLIYWKKYLNPRQQLLFVNLLGSIQKYGETNLNEFDKDYKNAIMTYLALTLGKLVDYNCRSASWHRRNQQISDAMRQRGISIVWDHTEVNPFIEGSGTLFNINKSILKGLKYSIEKIYNRGTFSTTYGSILSIENRVPLIVTDPPYLDDVQYPERSEFFYVWEKRALKNIVNLGDIPKVEDLSVGGDRTKEYFTRLFSLSCKKMNDLLTDDGLLVMFFAHSSIDAWDFVINSLQKTGFRITATWPVHTENPSNPLARGHASIMSSIIIVARKRQSDKSGYIEEIQDDVRDHLMKRLDEFWKYGLRGADLTVSAMGATLDVITQYSEIKSYTGEMQIKDVLELVQKYVAQYVLNRYMKNASGLDAATSFYLYTRLSQLEGMPFDTANLIAKSMNVNLKLFEKQGLIKSNEKGKAKGVILLNYTNREINTKQSLIDCVQFVMTTFAKGGYTEVERELATIPFSRNEIKDVLEALLSLPTEDPERQIAQKILERVGQSFPKQGQTGLDNF